MSGEAIKLQAQRFWRRLAPYQGMEMPQFSNGWLAKFKDRHGIKMRVRHGEAASIDDSVMVEQLNAIQAIAQQFHPQDVYNCDETGLFWKSTPDRGLATQQLSGTKKHKARITVHFCCNADGSHKLPIWFIGKSAHPRCFGAAKVNIAALDCIYKSNAAAWMISELMVLWLHWFSRLIGHRRVLLIMDNFSAHTLAVNIIQQQNQLQNIVICWLPPNTTSKSQPLDQGIIQSFKSHYRKRWLSYMLDEFDSQRNPLQTMNVLKAIRWSIQAWQSVTPQTITHCWYHSTIIQRPIQPLPDNAEPLPIDELSTMIHRLIQQERIQQAMSIENFLNPAEEVVIDSLDDLTEQIAIQYDPSSDKESDEEEEILPRIPIQQAFAAIQSLKLFEEQQEDGKASFIRLFDDYEACLADRRHISRRQQYITSFLA